MQKISLAIVFVFCISASSFPNLALAQENPALLLLRRAQEVRRIFDEKKFGELWYMMASDFQELVPQAMHQKTMQAIFGESFSITKPPKIISLKSAHAETSMEIIYFSNTDIRVGCQWVYWVFERNSWHIHGWNPMDANCP